MARRMLIDASHPEETRVVVVDGTRLEEFDFETASRKPLKGNIYLAKVIRIEPSLQAAFVEYGGNRHGFLAFSEIHPDYYQIPIADRERLIAEQHRYHAEDDDDEPEAPPTKIDRTDIEEARAERAEENPEIEHSDEADHDVEPPVTTETAEAAPVEAAPIDAVGETEPVVQAQPAEMPVEKIDGPVSDSVTEEQPADAEATGESEHVPAGELGAEVGADPADAPQPEAAPVEVLGGDDASER
jgi:ribonuclease E